MSKSKKAKLKGRPTTKGLKISTPTLSGNSLTVKWSYKDDMISEKNDQRAEGFKLKWHFTYEDTKQVGEKEVSSGKLKTGIGGSVFSAAAATLHPSTSTAIGKKVYLRGQSTITVTVSGKENFKKKEHSVTIDPTAFFPKLPSKLKTVSAEIIPYNSYGTKEKDKKKKISYAHDKKGKNDWTSSGTLKIKPPSKPTISTPAINAAGAWACTITAPKSDSKKAIDRRDTYYEVHVYNHAKKRWEMKDSGTSSAESFAVNKPSFASSYPNLGLNDWIGVKIYAWTRGIAGKTAAGTNPKERYFSYPMQPAIDGITYEADKPYVYNKDNGQWVPAGNVHNGLLTVRVSIPWDTKKGKATNAATNKKHFGISRLQLQRLSGTAIKIPALAEVANGWQDVQDSYGSSSATGLSDRYADAYPQPGDTVWYRIKATHDVKIRYSAPIRATKLENKVLVGEAGFIDATVVDNGVDPTGIYVQAGMNLASGQQQADTGIEFEWSNYKNAINSNQPPTTGTQELFSTDGETKTRNQNYNTNWKFSTPYYITGLTEGANYYLALRPYVGLTGEKTYGARAYWNDSKPVLFARKPTQVVLSAPAYVKTGEDFEVSWDFVSSVKQTSYILYYCKAKKQNGQVVKVNGKVQYDEKAIKQGQTSDTHVTLTWKDIQGIVQDRKVTLRVAVSCGGPYAKSGNADVTFPKEPSLKLSQIAAQTPNAKITAQKRSFQAETNSLGSTLYFRVISKGITVNHPDGRYHQAAGEVMASGTKQLTKSPISVELPVIPGLEDGCNYLVAGFVIDNNTGWRSREASIEYTVAWAHQAKVAATGSYAKGNLDDMSVKVYAAKPSGAKDTDTWSLYRVTTADVQLIKSGIAFNKAVTDKYPPYGKVPRLRYRVVTVTADGDLHWRDLAYTLPAYGLRFNWDKDKTLMLPYNLKHNDDFTKQFEGIRDLAGGKTGWWEPGVDRNSKYTTEMVRLGDPEVKESIYELASYPGPVFVRTENGAAFTANVNVKSFAEDYDRMVSGVTLECEEIDLVSEFAIE